MASSSLLSYGFLFFYSGALQSRGVELNPYNRCIANKDINGSQCTIVFHVDNSKIFHKNPEVVDSINKNLSEYFGRVTVSRRKTNNFSGIDVTFIDNRTVNLSMKKQIAKSIEWFGEKVPTRTLTPDAKHYFILN